MSTENEALSTVSAVFYNKKSPLTVIVLVQSVFQCEHEGYMEIILVNCFIATLKSHKKEEKRAETYHTQRERNR